MSQRNMPLWSRGLALILLLFAAWWLLATDVLRDTIGDSVGLLGLGVISVSILRGMHLRLGIWPEGPWRKKFASAMVLVPAVVLAALILLFGNGAAPALLGGVDAGTAVLAVVGAVFWGYSIAFVKQRPFLEWFGLAAALALVPLLVQLISSVGSGGFCVLTSTVEGAEGSATGCQAALLPSFAFMFAVGAPVMLVTEELAFRRIMIGESGEAGIVPILAAAAAVVAWMGLMAMTGVGAGPLVLWGGLGAIIAGSLYVLSRSLLVSACFNAAFIGGYWAVHLSRRLSGSDPSSMVGVAPGAAVTAAAAGLMLGYFVYRRNGVVGDMLSGESEHAPGD